MAAETVTATATAAPAPPPAPSHIGHQDIALGLILALLGILVLRSLLRVSQDRSHSLNVLDLITDPENGGMSFVRVMAWGGIGILSWALIAAALAHTMTDGMFIGYGTVVVAPVVAKLLGSK
jgi:hypothetical protein